MASQKALREVSIIGMDALWLSQHTMLDLLSKKKTSDAAVMAEEIVNLKLKILSTKYDRIKKKTFFFLQPQNQTWQEHDCE